MFLYLHSNWQVHYANEHGMPFLAVGGAHSCIPSIANVHDSIGISIRKLRSVHLHSDGHTATLNVGFKSGELIDALVALGK